jgi:hypothetical protein
VEPVRQEIPEIGDPIAPLFIAGSDEWTTRIVQRILVAHPACIGVPALSFLFAPGGLADLLAGRTNMERCLEVLRRDWYASSPDIQELCPPDRFETVVDRFQREWSGHHRKSARRLVLGLLGKRLSASPHVYWIDGDAGYARVADVVGSIVRNSRIVLALPTGWEPAPRAAWQQGSHVVRLDALLSAESDSEYLSLVRFLDIADHGLSRHALQREIAQMQSGDGLHDSPRRRRLMGVIQRGPKRVRSEEVG